MASVIESLTSNYRFDTSAELLVDVLSTYPALLSDDHFNLLATLLVSPWADERYRCLLQPDRGFDSVLFGQLLLAFGEEKCQWLMQSDDPRSRALLSKLCGLLGSDGYPATENSIFVPAVEFWSTFTENMSDVVHLDNPSRTPWADAALLHVQEAVSMACHKITYPPSAELSQWDASDRSGFSDARKDVIDLLQSAYALCGHQLVSTFSGLILSAVDDSAWLQLETAAFCLAGLSDCAMDDSRLDQALKAVFGSSLFSILSSPDNDIPVRTKQTCLHLVEQYTEYFERNIPSLAPALRLLFTMLGNSSMVASASRTILRLCSSCRYHLHSEAYGFLHEFQALVERQVLDCISSERILASIASIAQAVPDAHRKYNTCSKLLEFIEDDSACAKQLAQLQPSTKVPCYSQRCMENSADESPGLHIALKTLRCLIGVGKGFQSPTESAIDLDVGKASFIGYDSQLERLHKQIMKIIMDIEAAFGSNTEISELVCAVLRCGFSESEPGPFVLGLEDVTCFLVHHNEHVPRPGLFVSAACSFLSSLHLRGKPDIRELYTALLLWVVRLLRQLPSMDLLTPRYVVEQVTYFAG